MKKPLKPGGRRSSLKSKAPWIIVLLILAGATTYGVGRAVGGHQNSQPTTAIKTTTLSGNCARTEDFHKIPGIGDHACKVTSGPNAGLYKILFDNGTTTFTHGPDPISQ